MHQLTKLILFVVITSCMTASNLYSETISSPNIILIMCDDLGYGDLQCYNPKSIIQTPHLNQMAKDGIRFTRFYSAAPVCSPTRGSCLTGRHPYRYGVYFANTGHLPTKEITIPELLKPLRYQSGHFGKWHLGTLTKTVKDANRGGPNGAKHFSTPSMHGFDDSLVTESKVPTFDPLRSPIKASKNAWNALIKDEPSEFYGTRFWNHQLQQVQDNLDGDTSRIVMDRAIPFMKQAISVGQPFFATIWFHAPHLPVVASPKHTKAYKEYGTYDKNYFGCITAMDEQVGRLRQFLNEMQIEKDTMIWFCSDNGPEGDAGKAPGSAIHLRGRKRSLYEGGVRVPGILVWPEHLESTSMPTPCVTSDILPSIIDLLDINYPDSRDLDGISLFPIINGEKTLRDSPIGFQSSKQLAWHEENLKLYSPNQGKTWELYDLEKDPSESTNIAIKNQQRVNEMKIRLMNWIKSCQASDQGQDY